MRFGRGQPQEQLLDASKVDVVSVASDGTVELGLVQANAWTGSEGQLRSFQEKIQTYVAYAVDGGMVAAYPEATGLPWRIVIHSQGGPPDADTAYVIAALGERLTAYGGAIETR